MDDNLGLSSGSCANEISLSTIESSLDDNLCRNTAEVASSDVSYPLDANNLTAVLEAFYLIHNPDRISTIPTILEKYAANQLDLFQNLKERYNVDSYKPFDDIVAAAGPSSQVSQISSLPNVKGNDLIIDGTKPISVRSNLNNSTNNGMVGLSAALSLNMQDIAGVSSNIIAGTGRLFNGVSAWGLTSASSNAALSSPSKTPHNSSTTAADYINYAANKLNNVNESIQSKLDASDITTTGSNKSNSVIQTSSSKEDLVSANKLRVLEVDAVKLEREKNELEFEGNKLKATILNLKKENASLKQDSMDLRTKIESLQHTVVDLVEKESEARREIARLVERLKQTEQEKLECVNKAEAELNRSMSKHVHLMECMEINQRLAAQLEFLVIQQHSNREQLDCNSTTASESSENEFQTVTKDLTESVDIPPNEMTTDQLVDEVLYCRRKAKSLYSTFTVNKLELESLAQQNSDLSARVITQQAEIEVWDCRCAAKDGQLKTANQQIETLQAQLQEMMHKWNESQLSLEATERHYNNIKNEFKQASDDCRHLRDALSLAEESKKELVKACSNMIRMNEEKCSQTVSRMREMVCMEREELRCQLGVINTWQESVRMGVVEGLQQEVVRLRDETFRARRGELQRERQVSFLQTQLKEAASRIAYYTAEVEKSRATNNSVR